MTDATSLPDDPEATRPGIDKHIAHEDLSNRAPLPGGVPDACDVGKTAAPDAGWSEVGSNYGGLRTRPAPAPHNTEGGPVADPDSPSAGASGKSAT